MKQSSQNNPQFLQTEKEKIVSPEIIELKNFVKEYISDFEFKMQIKYEKLNEDMKQRLLEAEKRLDNHDVKIESIQDEAQINQNKINKINDLVSASKKNADQMLANEIRLNSLQKEFASACYKYDRIFLDNLHIPGTVGEFCTYKNLRDYIETSISQVQNLLSYKDKQTAEFKTIKEKFENLAVGISSQLENSENNMKNYASVMLKQAEANFKRESENIGLKINDLRMENNKYAVELNKNASELNAEKENLLAVKDQINKQLEELNNLNNLNNKANEENLDLISFYGEGQTENMKLNKNKPNTNSPELSKELFINNIEKQNEKQSQNNFRPQTSMFDNRRGISGGSNGNGSVIRRGFNNSDIAAIRFSENDNSNNNYNNKNKLISKRNFDYNVNNNINYNTNSNSNSISNNVNTQREVYSPKEVNKALNNNNNNNNTNEKPKIQSYLKDYIKGTSSSVSLKVEKPNSRYPDANSSSNKPNANSERKTDLKNPTSATSNATDYEVNKRLIKEIVDFQASNLNYLKPETERLKRNAVAASSIDTKKEESLKIKEAVSNLSLGGANDNILFATEDLEGFPAIDFANASNIQNSKAPKTQVNDNSLPTVLKKLIIAEQRIIQVDNFYKKKLEELANQIKKHLPISFNAYVRDFKDKAPDTLISLNNANSAALNLNFEKLNGGKNATGYFDEEKNVVFVKNNFNSLSQNNLNHLNHLPKRNNIIPDRTSFRNFYLKSYVNFNKFNK